MQFYYHNKLAMSIVYNPVQHNITIPIEIHNHFTKDNLVEGLVITIHVLPGPQISYTFH